VAYIEAPCGQLPSQRIVWASISFTGISFSGRRISARRIPCRAPGPFWVLYRSWTADRHLNSSQLDDPIGFHHRFSPSISVSSDTWADCGVDQATFSVGANRGHIRSCLSKRARLDKQRIAIDQAFHRGIDRIIINGRRQILNIAIRRCREVVPYWPDRSMVARLSASAATAMNREFSMVRLLDVE